MDKENILKINRFIFSHGNVLSLYDLILLNDVEEIRNYILREGQKCLHVIDEHGYTPLHYASYYGCDDSIHVLLELGGCDQIDGHVLIFSIINYSRPNNSLKILLDAEGKNIINRAIFSNNNTLLHRCAKHGHLKCFTILLEYGANIFAQNDKGETPRDILIKHRYDKNMLKLLDEYEEMYFIKEPGTE